MSELKISQGNGDTTTIKSSDLNKLSAKFSGKLLRPEDTGYEEARTIWNAMIDRKPALIAQCADSADVSEAVKFAGEYGLLTSIHGAGHNIAGNAVCDDGFMIDLSKMNSVRIDPDSRTANVGPGATLGDIDRETQKFNMVTPVGINSTTGISGLTLGGGFGWLSRKYGMTVDNLNSAEIVTADGKLRKINDKDDADLFWAIRGGGGNFGVVTNFEFKLYEFGPDVFAGLMVFPLDDAESALKKYREFTEGLGDDTSVYVVMRKAPPLPFLPESVHGTNILVFAIFHGGDPKDGEKIVEPIRGFGKMIGEHLGVQPYVDWQTAFDPLLTPGARNYWKSHNFTNLDDETIKIAVKYAATMPSPHCEVLFANLGGAAGKVNSTAYSHRDVKYIMNVHGRWEKAGDDKKCIDWARELYKVAASRATGGVYVNFMTADETDRVKAAYGGSYDRLAKIKKTYDPNNLFRLNQNIRPE